MSSTLRPRHWLPAAALLASTPAIALQLIDARDGVSVEAIISTKEATRIRLDGAPITDVFGNIYASNCAAAPLAGGAPTAPSPATNPAGEVVLECDRDKGEVYVRPVGNGTKPINLFVSSASATYTLLLRKSDVPADTIVLRDKAPRPATAGAMHAGPAGRASNHIRSLKAMLIAMASEHLPADLRVDDVHLPRTLWAEATFTLLRVVEGRGLIGETYRLTNASNTTMVLAEQEFDRDEGDVLAVAIENLNLRPGESTTVYVIRMGS